MELPGGPPDLDVNHWKVTFPLPTPFSLFPSLFFTVSHLLTNVPQRMIWVPLLIASNNKSNNNYRAKILLYLFLTASFVCLPEERPGSSLG